MSTVLFSACVVAVAQAATPATTDALPAPVPPAPEPKGPVLTLDRAIQMALRVQPTVRQARAATDVAAAREEEAAAPQLPQVNLNAGYQRQTGNFVPRPGAISTGAVRATSWNFHSYDFWNFGVNANQLIWDFGQTGARRRSAEASRRAAEASEQTTAHDVTLNVSRAFFQARAAKALIGVSREALANQQHHLEQVNGFVAAGLRPEIDVASVRTTLANARFQLISTTNGYDIARAQLDQAIGVPSDAPYDVADDEPPPVAGEDAPVDKLAQTAFGRRPELVAFARQRQAQEMVVRAVQGAYGPTLAATGNATESGTALDNMVPNWAIGAALTWPIFQGGLTRAQVREAQANLRNIVAQEDALKLQIRVEVEQGALAVRGNREGVLAADEAVANARVQLKLAEGRYQNGLGSVIELGDAQVALTNAEAQAVQARYNLAAARAQLATALGQ